MHTQKNPSPVRLCRLLAGMMVLFLFSCSASRMEQVVLPPSTPPLSRPIGYAVIEASYVQVRDAPASEGVALGYYRRGAVVPIEERRTVRSEKSAQVWLLNGGNERGWVSESEVRVYDNEAKARTAAKGLAK
jgi:hypothetical protein